MKKMLLLLSAAALWNCTDYAAEWDEKYETAFSNTHNDSAAQVSNESIAKTPLVCVDGSTTFNVEGECTFNFVCQNDTWEMQGLPQCANSSSEQDASVVCTEGTTTSLVDGLCTTNFVCQNNAWIPVDAPKCEEPSDIENSESKSEYSMVSTSLISGSSYGCSKAMFCGKSGNTRVKTGFNDGTDTYGYWFYYGDDNSSFSWPYGGTASTFVEKSVMPYGGIKGKASLGNGENAYLGLGFNVAGETGMGVDISNWKGLCVIYQSSAPFFLSLVDASNGSLTEYNDFMAALPKGNKANTAYLANIQWSDFYQETGWGKPASLTDVLTSTAQIAFKFKKVTSLANTFAIIAIGKYGTCK